MIDHPFQPQYISHLHLLIRFSHLVLRLSSMPQPSNPNSNLARHPSPPSKSKSKSISTSNSSDSRWVLDTNSGLYWNSSAAFPYNLHLLPVSSRLSRTYQISLSFPPYLSLKYEPFEFITCSTTRPPTSPLRLAHLA